MSWAAYGNPWFSQLLGTFPAQYNKHCVRLASPRKRAASSTFSSCILLECDILRDKIDAVTFLKLTKFMYINDLGSIFRDAGFELVS